MSGERTLVERIEDERTARSIDPMRPANPLLAECAAEITSLRKQGEALTFNAAHDARCLEIANASARQEKERADAAERRLADVRAELQPSFIAGMKMANAMFNLAQRGEINEDVRRQFNEMREEWDTASPALASAIQARGDQP